MPKRALLVCVAAVAAFGLPALPVAASPAPMPAAAPARTAASAPAGTYQSCPAPKAAGQMQCQSVVRASANKPMGVQPAAAPVRLRPGRPAQRLRPAVGPRAPGRPWRSSTPTTTRTPRPTSATYRAQYGLPPAPPPTAASRRSTRRGGTRCPAPTPAGPARSRSTSTWSAPSARSATSCWSRPSQRRSATWARRSTRAVRPGREVRLQQLRRRRVLLRHRRRRPATSTTRASRSPPAPVTAATARQYPAASQYVTSVGGTALTRTRPTRAAGRRRRGSGAGSPAAPPYDAKPTWQTDTGCAQAHDRRRLRRRRPGHRRRRLRHATARRLAGLRRHQRVGADHRRGVRAGRRAAVTGSTPTPRRTRTRAAQRRRPAAATARAPGLPVHRGRRLRRPDRPRHPERRRGIQHRAARRAHRHGHRRPRRAHRGRDRHRGRPHGDERRPTGGSRTRCRPATRRRDERVRLRRAPPTRSTSPTAKPDRERPRCCCCPARRCRARCARVGPRLAAVRKGAGARARPATACSPIRAPARTG